MSWDVPDHTAGADPASANSAAHGESAESGPDGGTATPGGTKGRRPRGHDVVEGGRAWRLRNWRLRNKLIVVLLVPVLVALVLAGLRGKSELDRSTAYENAAASVSTLRNVVSLMHELQKERALVVAVAAGQDSGARGRIRVNEQFDATDAALSRLDGYLKAHPGGRITNRLSAINTIRTAAIDSKYPDVATYAAYTDVLDAIILSNPEFTSTIVDSDLTHRASAALAVVEAKEYLARQTAILLIAAEHDEFPAVMLDRARAAEASYDAAIATFRADTTTTDAQFFADTVTGPEIDERGRIKATAFSRADQDVPLGIHPGTLARDGEVALNSLREVETSLLNTLHGMTEDTASVAASTAVRDALLVLVALLLALPVMYVVARSLLTPLRVLRRNALETANRRLPAAMRQILADPNPVEAAERAVDPMPVFTREETGQLARSFDALQEQAVVMATEQALLRDNINSIFVNLSRRSQALVERQLGLMDRLERDEQDPDQLATLFELDHLATRMRRNSESLLVLSGTGLSRQRTRPVPVSEVVGAAVSEVEHYARVEVATAPEVAVQGRAVSALVHVIAELLDNATSFSDPEKNVSVWMTITRKKELVIRIIDRGVGMTEEEIEAANERLADPPDLDVAVTRRMGLYVVARLAKQHNIEVRLRDNEDIDGGMIARISVPPELVAPVRPSPMSSSGPIPAVPGQGAPQSGGGAPGGTSQSGAPAAAPPPGAGTARGIGAAFTGGMPRLGPDGTPVGDAQRTGGPQSPADYPPFTVADLESPKPNGLSTNGITTTGPGGHTSGGHAPGGNDPGASGPSGNGPGGNGPGGNGINRNGLSQTGSGQSGQSGSGQNGQAGEQHPAQSLFGRPVPEPPGVAPPGGGYEPLAEDPPTERLPVYEEVLSQWFAADTDAQRAAASNGTADPAARGESPASGEDATPDEATTSGELTDTTDTTDATAAPDTAENTDGGEARAAETTAWVSPGDDGWQAAQALLDNPPPTETNAAGLPKRSPGANLVPGSAAPPPPPANTPEKPAAAAPPQRPPRSADAVRGRMSSLQQGVRRGRHALVEARTGDQTASWETRQPEEQH